MKRRKEQLFTGRIKKSCTHGDISEEFLNCCENEFKQDTANIIARNSITTVGSMFSTIDSIRLNEISHIFLNTVKKRNLKATNQGASGRCWMFAALNMFRHNTIRVLDLDNFEFSETYLFFWDKLERANSYLQWFIDHPSEQPGNIAYNYMLTDYMTDGGWWNTFANLVNKYGLVPKSAMKETYQSDDSEDMNRIIKEQLDSSINYIRKGKNIDYGDFKNSVVQQIYNTLVKFLGEPPKKFLWSFTNTEDDTAVIPTSPHHFKDMIIPDTDMNTEFITLAHIPVKEFPYYQLYSIRYTNNVSEGQCCTFYNVPIEEISRYAMKSISKGLAVWFVGDVRQHFNWFHSTLDDKLDARNTVFENIHTFEKGDRIILRSIEGNHAMALTGYNIDSKGQPINWQVENSWGYWDNETPGMDGFLNMSHTWFKKYVMQIVVYKALLSRTIKRKINMCKAIDINPWDCMAPALKTGIVNPPHRYLKYLSKKNYYE
jgi:bleomycin hydrolase